jgi:hypothetical protein
MKDDRLHDAGRCRNVAFAMHGLRVSDSPTRGDNNVSQPLKTHSLNLRAWPKAIIDACRPYDFIREFPEVAEASKER